MPISLKKALLLSGLVVAMASTCACGRYQCTKDVWKGTKSLWREYCNTPAEIDYEEKGEMAEERQKLAVGMLGIDLELIKLERVMLNADRIQTKGWLDELFVSLPWVEGVAGVRADGVLLGQSAAPGKPERTIDFNPILYEDAKQNSRALRCDVQQTAQGPVIVAATPTYDGVDFLGAMAVYFDMGELVKLVEKPSDVVILTPLGLLWPGRYDYAATPLACVDWKEAVSKGTTGTVTNASGSFVYQVRYFGNLPLIFAVAVNGSFPDGPSALAQTQKFCPAREKMAPPPLKPRTRKVAGMRTSAEERAAAEEAAAKAAAEAEAQEAEATARAVEAERAKMIQMRQQQMQQLRAQQMARIRQMEKMRANLIRQERIAAAEATIDQQTQSGSQNNFQQPSPFGPRGDAQKAEGADASGQKAEDAARKAEQQKAAEQKAAEEKAAEQKAAEEKAAEQKAAEEERVKPRNTFPDGRPSPFGPRN